MGKDVVQKPSFPVTTLLRKSAVESTALAQPFCVNRQWETCQASACTVRHCRTI